MPPRNNSHIRIKEVLAGKTLTARAIGVLIDKPEYAVVSALRGMVKRDEVEVVKPNSLSTPFFYRIKQS